MYGSGTHFPWRRHKANERDSSEFARLEEPSITELNSAWGHSVKVAGGGSDDKVNSGEVGPPSKQIQVKTEVMLISRHRLEYRDELY